MYTKEELKDMKREFWEAFARYCSLQPYLKGRRPMWMLYDTKVKGVELKFVVERHAMEVVLEVNHRSEEERLIMYEKLTWYRETLDAAFGEPLDWNPTYSMLTGKRVARISYAYVGDPVDFHRPTDWGVFFSFLAQRMYALETAFVEIVDFIRE